uniref:Sperm tail PG-rich repeat containing 1 n=1 Tax=Sphenodon punctatus TaxID=8508 RepID=A0A8D0HF94_SPHPU
KGFNSQAKRFQYTQNEIPGPGFYDITHRSAEMHSTSLSTKGTGYFPSLVREIRIPNYPAANTYNIPSRFHSKKDFSIGYSSMFQQPIARKIAKNPTPAPNQYNACTGFCKQSNSVSAQAVFQSKTRRGVTYDKADKCHYRINVSLVQQSPKVTMSCFKSTTSRDAKVNTLSPGPAAYQLYDSAKATKKIPLNFSVPAVPPPKNPPLPGPGQYEIVNYEGPTKHYISSAVFVSNTGRWTGDGSRQEIPGPGTYLPEIPGKQSFICNTDKKWLPVL